MKKVFSGLFLASLMLTGLTACGSKGTTVVAEGTGHTEHGMVLDMIYQEYSDGTMKVYQANIYGDSQALIRFEGKVNKGVDQDGDPLVTVVVEKAIYVTFADAASDMNVPTVSDATADYVLDEPITTNTYDASTGEYTLPFEWSLYGYTNLTASIEVKPVSTPTEPKDFLSKYITKQSILDNCDSNPE